MRRLVKPLGALLTVAAFASLSSCSTFDRHDVAASVNGHDLTFEQLDALTNSASASVQRETIKTWLQFAAVTGGPTDASSADALDAATAEVLGDLGGMHEEEARARYEKGLAGSPYACLGAILIEASTDEQEVISKIDGGMSLADAAEQYSADPQLAATGGAVYADSTDPTTSCIPTADFTQGFAPAVVEPLTTADVGEPVYAELSDGARVILVLRAFAELTTDERQLLAKDFAELELTRILTTADVYVNPRLGRWDASTATVVPDYG